MVRNRAMRSNNAPNKKRCKPRRKRPPLRQSRWVSPRSSTGKPRCRATTIAASAEAAAEGAAGIVNGTPIGMLPDRGIPIEAGAIKASQWVADAVYHPLYTPLLKAAQKAGATVMTGRELAIHQGVDAFRLFTGLEASETVIGAAFDAVLAARERAGHAA